MRTLHIIGGGLSGLSAAVGAVDQGWRAIVHEAAAQAGGRCRSFHDEALGRTIDNGNHLLLGANRATLGFLDTIGARDQLLAVEPARIPFLDLNNGRQWSLRPGPPWWPLMAKRGIPDATIGDFLKSVQLFFAGPDATVSECLPHGVLFDRFWSPMATAALNTDPKDASARLLMAIVTPIMFSGAQASRPYIARNSLSQTFVDPAVAYVEANGGNVRLGRRLRRLDATIEGVQKLQIGDDEETLEAGDRVILAVPPQAAAQLLPNLTLPLSSSAIVNAHFRLDQPVKLPGDAPFVGLIGGTAQWLFARADVVAVTVSAADQLADSPIIEIAEKLWTDVARALALDGAAIPPHRIIKEQRATFAQTPVEVARRPASEAANLENLALAGDWTATGLPATIEGAIRSGMAAVAALSSR